MGIVSSQWPVGKEQPWGIKSDYTWKEMGTLFRLIDERNIGLVIETGVHAGDVAAWMLLKGLIDEEFNYYGISLELDQVSGAVRGLCAGVTQSFIAPGLATSPAIVRRLGKLIQNSYKPALVFCNGKDQEKEFYAYMNVLRPGDVIVVTGFPVTFSLRHFQKYINDGKLERIAADLMQYTRFIGGLIL